MLEALLALVVDVPGAGAVWVAAGEPEEDPPDPADAGAPVYAMAGLGTGPIPAEAEAPIPTRPPCAWPDVLPKFFAFVWKEANVFPVVGALMAPTIPISQ